MQGCSHPWLAVLGDSVRAAQGVAEVDLAVHEQVQVLGCAGSARMFTSQPKSTKGSRCPVARTLEVPSEIANAAARCEVVDRRPAGTGAVPSMNREARSATLAWCAECNAGVTFSASAAASWKGFAGPSAR